MTIIVLTAFVVLTLTTLCSALNLALVQTSESALLRRLEHLGLSARGAWIIERWNALDDAVSFLRTWGRIGFFAIVLWAIGRSGDGTMKADLRIVAEALLISALMIWLFTSVVAGALARYAALDLIALTLPALRVIEVLLRPITAVSGGVDEAVKRLTGANLKRVDAEEDLLRSIEDTQRQGGIDQIAARMMENVVEFTDTVVGEVMTPRTAIEGLAYTDDLAAIRSFIHREGHSRIPVYEESLDHIVGVLYVKDLVTMLGADGSSFALRPLLRQPIRVPETKPVRDLLIEFQRSKVHMAVVIDEFGGTAGLATIEDVLEEIVGEISDEHEGPADEAPKMIPRADGACEAEGRVPMEEVASHFGVTLPADVPYTTVAGFALYHFGRVPQKGETFEADGLRVTVLEATPTAVLRLGIERRSVDGDEER